MRSAKFGPNCGKLDKFLAHGQAHMGQMGIWLSQCTSTGLDNSTELRMEKICQAVTEIWVPQVWQPPARPPGPWRQYPSSPEGGGGGCKKDDRLAISKIFERVVYNQQYEYFSSNKLFYEGQYGFRGDHSTALANIELTDRIISALDEKKVATDNFYGPIQGFRYLKSQNPFKVERA